MAKKECNLHIRLTEEQNKSFVNMAERAECKMSDIVRAVIDTMSVGYVKSMVDSHKKSLKKKREND